MALVAAVGGGAVALAWQLNAATWVVQLVAVLALIDFTLVAQFFRVPKRTPVAAEGQILCPSDGKVVVIDPRRTETAKKADQHLFIRPETDALFMLAMVHTLFEEQLVTLGHLEGRIDGLEQLSEAVKPYAPETVADACGMTADAIRELARNMAAANSAVCYSRMGASTQSFGGLCQWLNNVLNILTGNFDRRGGAMFPQPAFDLVRDKKGKPSSYGRYESRVRKLPYFNNEFPVATLADEILTPGDGQIRAMITIAGNPVLSAPGGARLEDAFASLDFMVSVDIYLNETTRHADIILPATTGLEVPHFDVFFNSFAVRNTAKFSEPMFEKGPDQGKDPSVIVEEKGLKQVTDTDAIEAAVDDVIAANPDKVAQAQERPKMAGWFVGQVMQATGGKANPQAVNKLVMQKLGLE